MCYECPKCGSKECEEACGTVKCRDCGNRGDEKKFIKEE